MLNHFAQNRRFNRGAYRALEDKWAKMLRNGEHVRVSISPHYAGPSLRPDYLTVSYTTQTIRRTLRFNNSKTDNKHGK